MPPPLTTPAVLNRMAFDFSDHPAVVTEDRNFTFAELHDEVRRTAAALAGRDVRQGDRVAIWLPNTWHWVIACLAIHYAGAVVVPINTRYTAEEATDILDRAAAKLLIGMGRFLGTDRVSGLDRQAIPGVRHIVRVPIQDAERPESKETDWDDFLAGPQIPLSEVDGRAAAVRADDVADILFTSGTTGRSKGVLCAHRQSLSASAAWAQCGRITAADRYLCINPFFHNFGYKAGILACLQTGATLIPQLTFEPEQAMRTVEERRVTVLPGPPTIYQTLLDHPARQNFDLSSLRFAVTGAANVPVLLIERMQRELDFDTVLTAYGLTEATGFGTMCRPEDDPVTVATTCGRPIAGFELRIDNPDDTGAGEVLLRGPNVMLGYLEDPVATAAAIDPEGWLHTGDVGAVDAAGNLRITDRLKDMYVCGGFNVYPAEVEQVLARLDGIADVAVIGVADERLGEVGRAFVVRRTGSDLGAQDVIEYARKHVANFKAPRSVVFLDALPRNPGGKVVKTALREIA